MKQESGTRNLELYSTTRVLSTEAEGERGREHPGRSA